MFGTKGNASVLQPDDVRRLAKHLSVDLETEPYLIRVLRLALYTPLPPSWRLCEEGYINDITGQVQESHPGESYFQTQVEDARKAYYIADSVKESSTDSHSGGSASIHSDSSSKDDPWMDFVHESGQRYMYNFKTGQEVTLHSAFSARSASSARSVRPESSTRSFSPPKGSRDDTHSTTSSSSMLLPSGTIQRLLLSQRKAIRRRLPTPRYVEFKTWWLEGSGVSKSVRKDATLRLYCSTGAASVTLSCGSCIEISRLEGKRGPIETWDLHVGKRLTLLGRPVTLQQASLQTAQWLESEVKFLGGIRDSLQTALLKYGIFCTEERRGLDAHAQETPTRVNLRSVLEEIETLRRALADLHLAEAEKLTQHLHLQARHLPKASDIQ